jgi:hypothetical protein
VPFPDDSVATNVLAQDLNAHVINPAMAMVDTQTIEGESFRRWVGVPRANSMLRVVVRPGRGRGAPLAAARDGRSRRCGIDLRLWRLRSRKAPVSLENLTDRIAALEAGIRDGRRRSVRKSGSVTSRIASSSGRAGPAPCGAADKPLD